MPTLFLRYCEYRHKQNTSPLIIIFVGWCRHKNERMRKAQRGRTAEQVHFHLGREARLQRLDTSDPGQERWFTLTVHWIPSLCQDLFLEARDAKIYMLKICVLKMCDLVRRTDVLNKKRCKHTHRLPRGQGRDGGMEDEWRRLSSLGSFLDKVSLKLRS